LIASRPKSNNDASRVKSSQERKHALLIVDLPFVMAAIDGGAVQFNHLIHVLSARQAKRVAQASSRGTLHFGFDKVEYRGQSSGTPQYGPVLSRWSTAGQL
jgi:hypothetical protein